MERDTGHGFGTDVWGSAAWRALAVEWIDERLAAAGRRRTGPVEQPHLRPWATVLRVPADGGTVWMKAAGPGTAFEVGLLDLLARQVPDRVLVPLATDPGRGWMLLPDGGPSLGERLDGEALADELVDALVAYGRLQRDLAPHADEMLALGVADMRPAAMPERYAEAVAATGTAGSPVGSMGATVDRWCAELGRSPVPASLDHNDLHPWNVLGGTGGTRGAHRFYDWGDAVVAHPFAAMLVPLQFVRDLLGADLDDPRYLRARDAYLAVFADHGTPAELAPTLEVACRVAKIARTLTWDRAVRAAREDGQPVDADWATAPRETLATLPAASYLTG